MAAGGDSRRRRERPSWGEGLPTLVQGASPVILRVLGSALGAVLVVAAAGSVIGTVVVPLAFTSRLTACADWLAARRVPRRGGRGRGRADGPGVPRAGTPGHGHPAPGRGACRPSRSDPSHAAAVLA